MGFDWLDSIGSAWCAWTQAIGMVRMPRQIGGHTIIVTLTHLSLTDGGCVDAVQHSLVHTTFAVFRKDRKPIQSTNNVKCDLDPCTQSMILHPPSSAIHGQLPKSEIRGTQSLIVLLCAWRMPSQNLENVRSTSYVICFINQSSRLSNYAPARSP